MMRNSIPAGVCFAAAVLMSAVAPSALGQTAPAPAADKLADDEVVVLSPFVVNAASDQGYTAKDTLAGTRVRTELKDVAAPISVITEEFLRDTGAKNSQDLLVYTTNTEVGGTRGNFSGLGGSSTFNENSALLRPNQNTRVRGLDSADNTRDYFLTEIPWDGYNVARVDLQRGPNSILFGVGSPAGIVNTSLNGAAFKAANKVETRFDKYGSFRNSLDINYVILPQQLAVRVAALSDESKFQQKPAFNNDRRVYAALRFDPKLFGEGAHTSIRVNYETGKVIGSRPRSLPPIDSINPWFLTGTTNGVPNLNKLTINHLTTWDQYHNDYPAPSGTEYPWFKEAFMGRMMSSDIAGYYEADAYAASQRSPSPFLSLQPTIAGTLGIGSTGLPDGNISGIPFNRPAAVTTYNKYARAVIPGGKYYSDTSLTDPTIFDFFNKLIDGDNSRQWQNWHAANFAASQTFFNDRLGFELVYDYQRYDDGQVALLNGDQYQIQIDINTKMTDGSNNANVGRPYVGNSGQYGNAKNKIARDGIRFTTTGEVRAEDFMDKTSFFAKLLGKHVFTGVLSQDVKRTDYRNFARWASEPAFAQTIGSTTDITSGSRQYDWIAYLGPSLASKSSAAGASLSAVTTTIQPAQYVNVRYFNPRWARSTVPTDANYVDPAASYSYIDTSAGNPPIASTQSENPANYVGWTTGNFRMLSWDQGNDIESLYTSGTKGRNIINSRGLTWQGYLWDGNIVPVFGWRRDEIMNATATAPKGQNNVSVMNYEVNTATAARAAGESKSWGVVLHTPRQWRDKLPGGTNLSVFFNRSENFKADAPRGDVFGNKIDNPLAKTKDYGVVISTLNDKLTLKINWFETKMANATLQADSAGFSGSLYYVWALPYWEATHSLAALDGIASPQLRQGNWGWPWNGIATNPDGSANNARILAVVTDFFKNFPMDQNFVDQYGLGMNVAAMHAATTPAQMYAAIRTYGLNSSGVYDTVNGLGAGDGLALQPAYGGNLRDFGSGPVASVDTTSKGMEFELSAQPVKNWNITVNASKTTASRTALSPTLDRWITTYTAFMAGDAGLVRLWGGDTFRTNWANNILAPYSVLKNQQGSSAPEVAPWRFNVITTYSFDSGPIKGSWIGGAYRWEDKRILGYQYKASIDTLDISKPWYGPTTAHIDMWMGYSHKITSKIDWRIQLNLRNVGEKTKLVPVTMQPNGAVALSRIQEGMLWQLTNTFSF